MICKNCGASLAEGVKFCTYCGNQLEVQTPVMENNINQVSQTDIVNPILNENATNVNQNMNHTSNNQFISSINNEVNNSDNSTFGVVSNEQIMASSQNEVAVDSTANNLQSSEVNQISDGPNQSGINLNSQNIMSSNPTIGSGFSDEQINPVNSNIQPSTETTNVVNSMNSNQPIQTTVNMETINNPQPYEMPNLINSEINNVSNFENRSGKKKKSKAIIVIFTILLIGAIGALIYFFMTKSSNTDAINDLEKASKNMETIESMTMDANITLKMDESSGMSIPITMGAKILFDEKNSLISANLNLGMLGSFLGIDNIDIYGDYSNDNLIIYIPTSTLDLISGVTSQTNGWVKYSASMEDLFGVDYKELSNDSTANYKLSDVLDSEHFKYIDENDGLKHYEMVIDKELMEKLEDMESSNPTEETLDELENIDMVLDVYINSETNYVEKIEMDFLEMITNMNEEEVELAGLEGITEFKITYAFSGFNSTTVTLPSDVTSSMTMEDYQSQIMIEEDYDLELESDYNYSNDF